VSVSEPAFHHGGWRAERPLAAVGAQMNLAYAVAVTLLDGTALAAQFAPTRIDADDVWALIERTTLRHEAAFDERFEDGYNTRLEIGLVDGRTRTSFIDQPRGGLLKPLSDDEVVDKFRALTAPLIDPARADEIENMVLGLEQLTDANELVALLAPPVNPIFAAPEVPA
jgi:aconitate decarboxylase